MIRSHLGHISTKQIALVFIIIAAFAITSCGPRPRGRADFSAISSPQIPVVSGITPTPLPTSTHTPVPPTPTETPTVTATSTPSLFSIAPGTIPSTLTPTPTITPTPTENIEPTDTPTPIPPTATNTPRPIPTTPPDPPRRGGSWDMEDGFVGWANPYGDDCSGSRIATGWQGFTSRGQYGSSCFVQNEYSPNVFSGGHSQQITFDFVDSHAGLFRTFDSKPGHRYQAFARLRHVNTVPPMQFHFGVDLTGSTDWMAPSVIWTPWREFRIDEWITHEQIFTATGAKTTVFIKGYHEAATQGGATFFDHVEVIDLGR